MAALLKNFFTPPRKRIPNERELIKLEAKHGGLVFGAVPKGHRREFFCLDSKTWVWYEQWIDEHGKPKSVTTRYEVRPNGVIKIQDGHRYEYITGKELQNLAHATRQYYITVARKVYGRAVASA